MFIKKHPSCGKTIDKLASDLKVVSVREQAYGNPLNGLADCGEGFGGLSSAILWLIRPRNEKVAHFTD